MVVYNFAVLFGVWLLWKCQPLDFSEMYETVITHDELNITFFFFFLNHCCYLSYSKVMEACVELEKKNSFVSSMLFKNASM